MILTNLIRSIPCFPRRSNNIDSAKNTKLRILVTGASGFVGRALCEALKSSFQSDLIHLVGLSRHSQNLQSNPYVNEWVKGDLFSLRDAERVLEGVDVAIYLVHSMMPATRLVQGSFDNFDLALADNFARAARRARTKRIIYLGGLIDRSKKSSELSRHLRSRLEVEDALGFSRAELFCLRAGLVVGSGGSSFEIMKNLVKRLLVIVCPPWTLTKTQPIALDDLVAILSKVIFDQSLKPGIYDVGGASVLTYRAMLEQVAASLGLKRFFVSFPYVPPEFSRLWVSFFTGSPKELVTPLIASLKTPMVVQENVLMKRYGIPVKTFEEAIPAEQIPPETKKPINTKVRAAEPISKNNVTSVQRLFLPEGWSVEKIAKEYGRWLNLMLWPLMLVETDERRSIRFYFKFLSLKVLLLHLEHIPERSSKTREFYYIREGLMLAKNANKRGRFEFRKIQNKQEILVAIFDYEPRLPWMIYRYSQALVHLYVMWGFGRFLKSMQNIN